MDIRRVFETVNQMCADGVVDTYAVGGAVGATFYLEPVATLGVDIFIRFPSMPGSLAESTSHVVDYLVHRGGTAEREYIVLSGMPVQFLPPTSPLVEEAMVHAVWKDVDGVPVRVFTAENLAAIALQTGRAKDKSLLVQLFEEDGIDALKFNEILARNDLLEKWKQFEQQFLTE
jgi:hypothetical protein